MGKQITLTLEQIEIIINSELPASARIHEVFWTNSSLYPSAESVSNAGWKAKTRSEKGKVAYLILRKET
jgi:hypothetical protein